MSSLRPRSSRGGLCCALRRAALIGLATSAVACSVDVASLPGSGGGSGSGSGSTSDPADGKLSSNGLLLDFATLESFDPTRPLGHWASDTEAVADASGSSAALAGVLGRSDGLEHLTYLATCALDRGTELAVTDPSDGSTVELPGLYGLAPDWVDHACDQSCQRWVSACLLAHANAFGDSVMISMRGAHPGLAWNSAIESDYPVQEGAFYGNAFVPADATGERPVFACMGRALITFSQDGVIASQDTSYLTRRICSTGAACGLVEAGPCYDPNLIQAGSCTDDAGQTEYFSDCRGAAAGDTQTTAPLYREVITTYLRNQ